MDHAGAFGHAGEGVGGVRGGGEGEGGGEEFGEGVGGADGAGGGEPGGVAGGEGGESGGDTGEDARDGEALADYACGHDKRGGGGGGRLELGVERGGHADCVVEAASAGHGVGAAGVDDYAANALAGAVLDRFSAGCHGCGLKLVLREDCGC